MNQINYIINELIIQTLRFFSPSQFTTYHQRLAEEQKKKKLNHTQNITVISDKRFDEKESCKLTTELRVWCNW